MLESQYRGRYQYRHLLVVGHRLERGTYRHLCLTEAHIAAHQTVHRFGRLHVPFHEFIGLLLVRRILIGERGFQLVLQIAVRRKGEPASRLALGIECNQLASYVLDGVFGRGLHALPRSRTEFVYAWRLAVGALVARYAVDIVDVHQKHVVIPVHQLDGIGLLAVIHSLHHAAETAYSVVDMHHEIPDFQFVQFGHRHALVAIDFPAQLVAVVAVENLVVGVDVHARLVIAETLMQGDSERFERHLRILRIENVAQSFDLRLVLRQYIRAIAILGALLHISGEQVELLVEFWLRSRIEQHSHLSRPLRGIGS